MVSMTVINYYLFQKQVKEDLQVMAETIVAIATKSAVATR